MQARTPVVSPVPMARVRRPGFGLGGFFMQGGAAHGHSMRAVLPGVNPSN